MRIVMLGPFGLHPKATMLARALPMARALALRGHEITLLMPPWHTPDEAGRHWVDEVNPAVHLEYVSLAGFRIPLFGHLVVALRMARRALALDPDLVHVFKPKAYGGLAAWILRSWRTQPVLVVDTDDWEGPGGWNDLEPYSPLQRVVFAWQERWGLTHADQVTVASRALETLAWAQGVDRSRVTYLPNAVGSGADGLPDAPRVVKDSASGESSLTSPTILLYTRFFEFDVRRPLQVLAGVRRQLPNARLLIVGRGLFGEEERFLDQARRMGLAEAVDYRGWLEADAFEAAVGESDVALYPFDDTLINRTKSSAKLLALMARGLPVVADRVGELAEVIVDGVSGRLVPCGDDAAMTEAVVELLSDGEARRRLGRGARERIAAAFTWEGHAEAVESVYEKALGRPEARDRVPQADPARAVTTIKRVER